MIDGANPAATGPAALSPEQKARLIYSEAQGELAGRLWRAALGETAAEAREREIPSGVGQPALGGERPVGLDRLLAVLAPGSDLPTGAPPATQSVESTQAAPQASSSPDASIQALREGPNARYAPLLESAAGRTGIPPAALAAIVDAEAGKGAGGAWQTYSRNPRSSAAGLGQFLKGSWEGMAEQPGTWLNAAAAANGWLDPRGQVRSESRGALLAMRYDPQAAIETVADYAGANLAALRKSGVQIGGDVAEVARAAYLGHHLGPADARRFLAARMDPERARRLLGAQVGGDDAERRIATAGGAVAAHRTWLLGYVERHVRPDRFA